MASLLFSISVTDKSSCYSVNAKRTLSFSMCFENERLWNNWHRKLYDATNLFENSYIVLRRNNYVEYILLGHTCLASIHINNHCIKS